MSRIMLLVRIKLKNRREKNKIITGSKEKFDFNNRSYDIEEEGIYITTIYGFLKVPCLDYYVGNPKPINYYDGSMKPRITTDADVIDRMVKGWFELNFGDMVKLILYATIGSVAIGAINLIMSIINNSGMM